MEKLTELKDKYVEKRPVPWEMIPDIPLTKNQVVMYMPRQLVGDVEDDITSAMINNYIKDGIMPKANGKTYNREHIAYLTAVSLFKKSLTVKDIGSIISLSRREQDMKEYYDKLGELLDKELNIAAEKIREDMTREEMVSLAVELGISAYVNRTLCEQLMGILAPETAKKEKPSKEDKAKKDDKDD